jgi:hypothetical protein
MLRAFMPWTAALEIVLRFDDETRSTQPKLGNPSMHGLFADRLIKTLRFPNSICDLANCAFSDEVRVQA